MQHTKVPEILDPIDETEPYNPYVYYGFMALSCGNVISTPIASYQSAEWAQEGFETTCDTLSLTPIKPLGGKIIFADSFITETVGGVLVPGMGNSCIEASQRVYQFSSIENKGQKLCAWTQEIFSDRYRFVEAGFRGLSYALVGSHFVAGSLPAVKIVWDANPLGDYGTPVLCAYFLASSVTSYGLSYAETCYYGIERTIDFIKGKGKTYNQAVFLAKILAGTYITLTIADRAFFSSFTMNGWGLASDLWGAASGIGFAHFAYSFNTIDGCLEPRREENSPRKITCAKLTATLISVLQPTARIFMKIKSITGNPFNQKLLSPLSQVVTGVAIGIGVGVSRFYSLNKKMTDNLQWLLPKASQNPSTLFSSPKAAAIAQQPRKRSLSR